MIGQKPCQTTKHWEITMDLHELMIFNSIPMFADIFSLLLVNCWFVVHLVIHRRNQFPPSSTMTSAHSAKLTPQRIPRAASTSYVWWLLNNIENSNMFTICYNQTQTCPMTDLDLEGWPWSAPGRPPRGFESLQYSGQHQVRSATTYITNEHGKMCVCVSKLGKYHNHGLH